MIDYNNPWIFEKKPFTDENISNFFGFVYRLTDEQGKMYIGRKYFYSSTTPKGAKRKKKSISNWKKYYSSNKEIQQMVKDGHKFTREILSLHELKRDVNYGEVKAMFYYNVLEAKDCNGNKLYYNDNISGKYTRELQLDFSERSVGQIYNN